MKIIAGLFVLTLTLGCVFAQTSTVVWHAAIKVVDESGGPVAGADVEMSWDVSTPNNTITSAKIDGLTDSNGLFEASHEANSSVDLGFRASKAGYYQTTIGHEFAAFRESDPEKLSPHVTLLLKKIQMPIAMYSKWLDSEPPAFKKTGRPPIVFNKTIGYDLMAGDWVAPYGKGVSADINFTEEFNKAAMADFYYKLTVSFPRPGDGIQEFSVPDVEKGSALRSPHEAPADGYQARLIRENYHHPGQPSKADYDPSRNYFFRVRTALDVNGNVVSALYGKIYGDPEQMNFRYYLNPTPNSRNVEFDPKQNLLVGLKSFERVQEP